MKRYDYRMARPGKVYLNPSPKRAYELTRLLRCLRTQLSGSSDHSIARLHNLIDHVKLRLLSSWRSRSEQNTSITMGGWG